MPPPTAPPQPAVDAVNATVALPKSPRNPIAAMAFPLNEDEEFGEFVTSAVRFAPVGAEDLTRPGNLPDLLE